MTLLPPATIGQCATLACLLEVSAPKPGNVHRGADFEDMTFSDFLVSAVAIAPAMQQARQTGVGPAVYRAIQATRRSVSCNTNLGTVLLLAPLATVAENQPLASGIAAVLAALTPTDAADVYRAIQLAQPGGLGRVSEMDVADTAPGSLLEAMRAAAQRDLVARQYCCQFATVLEEVVPALRHGADQGWSLTDRIVHTHLLIMHRYPDSLIARKCGSAVAAESAARAGQVLEIAAADPEGIHGEPYFHALADLDFWLRSDRQRRNPGTTADLIAAGLFAALREGRLP